MHEAARGRFPWVAVALATAGGVLLIVGSFQSWSEISGGGTTAALYGIPDRSLAWVTFGAGVAVLVLTLVVALARGAARRVAALLIALAATVGAAVGVVEAFTSRNDVLGDFAEQLASDYGGTRQEMRELLDQAVGTGQLMISVGMGIYLVIAGGGLAVAGGLLAMRRSHEAPPEPVAVPMPSGAFPMPSGVFPGPEVPPPPMVVMPPPAAPMPSEPLAPAPPEPEVAARPIEPVETEPEPGPRGPSADPLDPSAPA